MKKQLILIIASVLALSSCAKNDLPPLTEADQPGSILNGGVDVVETDAEPFDYLGTDLSTYIKIGNYNGLEVTKESDVLTDEEFETEIGYLLENYAYYKEYTDRNVEEGDTVRADYAGYRDGIAFEGGTAKDATLTAASDTGYIPGFAEAFIGQTPGQEFSFDVTFPEDYGNTQLAGVGVTFVCTVHAILGDELIYPELTDEFVSENFGYSNAEEFRIAYRSSVEEEKKSYVESNMFSALWTQVVEGSEVLQYPETEVVRIYNEQRAMYEQYAASLGTDYDTFISSYIGVTDEELVEECRTYVKEDLVMYQLVKELKVEITDEEFMESAAYFAQSYNMTTEELIAYYGESTVRATIYWQEIMEIVAADAVIAEQ